MELKQFKNKKVLILGFGREGRDSFFVLRKLFPDKIIGIADEEQITNYELGIKKKDRKFELYFGKNYLEAIKDYDVIIRTPGIPLKKIQPFVKKGSKLTSQTEIFFDNFDGVVIGVTGTKGKGTTSSLIHSILQKAGIKSRLVGNIGKPVLGEMMKSSPAFAPAGATADRGEEIFVYELSDHQLQGLKKSPHIAVFLNLFRDHLDYYKTEKEYQKAKENITRWQGKGDWLIYNSDDAKVKQIAKNTKAKTIAFSEKDKTYLKTIIQDKDIPLVGEFNKLNILASVRVGELLGISKEKIKQGIKAFKGLPHRLEFVSKHKGIEFYNGSMATIPEVTIVTIKSLKNTDVLIIGGSEKGSDYTEMEKAIKDIKTVIVLGEGTGDKIKRKTIKVDSMKQAVKIAFEKGNKLCLLSPGAASFNLFSSYAERGDLFKKWVRYYGKK